MYLVDRLHQHGIGVILDWVPSHFPGDAHGLRYFDGTYLFEHAAPKRGYQPDWHSYIFNYGRHEVRAFLIGKMPGDDGQKFANLRALYGYMFGHPGKKLLFMGSELAQRSEWNHDRSLDWHLLRWAPHQGVRDWLRDLNHLYRNEPALFEQDFVQDGFEWIDGHDWGESTLGFIRKAKNSDDIVLVVCNFTPIPRTSYRLGVPRGGWWREALNSDAESYGGTGRGNLGGVEAAPVGAHGRYHSLVLDLPPLAALFFKAEA
jgi:1,4-alpha-glucan branching enzyme